MQKRKQKQGSKLIYPINYKVKRNCTWYLILFGHELHILPSGNIKWPQRSTLNSLYQSLKSNQYPEEKNWIAETFYLYIIPKKLIFLTKDTNILSFPVDSKQILLGIIYYQTLQHKNTVTKNIHMYR